MPEERLSHHEIRKHLAAAEEFIRAVRRGKPDTSDGSLEPHSDIRNHELQGALRKISAILDKLLMEQNGELSPLKSSLRMELSRHENADRLLREREERLRLAFQAAGQGLYDLNVQTGDAVVSPEYAEMLGYDPATFVETNAAWIERLHPEDRAPVATVYQNYISGKIPEYRVEFRQRTKNGAWKWILSLGKIVERDEAGAPLRMLGTHTDITDRKNAEEQLRESELFKDAVLNGLSSHIAVLDEQGSILAVNDAWSQFAVENGLEPEKAGPGANYLKVCEDAHGPNSEQALPFAAGIRDVITGRRDTFEMEYPCDSPKERRWFIGRVTRIRGGHDTRVIIAHEAITPRKMAEEALEKAAADWQKTFDAVGSGISLLDADMRIVRVNKAVSQLLGRAPEELTGKHCWTVVHGSERPHEDCPTARMLVSRKTESGEVKIGECWFQITADPMFETNDRLSGAVHVMRDITERKRMVDRLKQSEALLADAQQLAHVGSFQIETDTGALLWSSEMHRIFDIPVHAPPLDFEEISALTHPADRDILRKAIKKLLLEAGPVSTDFRIFLPSGRKKHLRLIGQELRDEQGRLFGISGAVLDMTAEMLSAADQKNDEERLALLLQMTGMQNASEQELCEWAIEAVVKITGSTGGYFHLFDEKEQSITLTAWSSAVKQECVTSAGQHYPLEKAGIWADSIRQRAVVVHNDYAAEQHKSGLPEGHFRLMRHLGVPVFDGDSIVAAAGVANKEEPYTASDVRQIQFFMNDMWKIIARSRAEKKLAESEAAYRGLFETSQDGIFRIGRDGRVERANAAFAGIFGYASPDELIGRSISDFTDNPLDWQVYQAVMQQKGQIQRYPFQMRSAAGAHRDVEVTANMIRNSSGDFVALEGIVRDVTESRQLAEQLRHAQKMEAIGRLAGGIAHDFNNILSAIIGFASLPLMSGSVGELERTTLQQIIELTERASSLTRGLMAFSRRQVMTMKATDMNQVVRVSTKLLHRLIGEDIILNVHETSEPLPVMADVGQLEQVLMNLATNARDAMPDGGSLTIETRRVSVNNLEHEGIPEGVYSLTTVTDTGTGIPAEHLDKIFEPFFTTKESGKGTGLGLASVYGIMQQHSGAVRVVSTPGSGTSFLLYIPLSERAGESLAEHLTSPVSGGTETLLIVEDDTPLRTIMRRVLAMHGYTVIEAETGAAAVGICTEREGKIDLVLSDAVMPEMGGFEAWQIIHERFPSIHFVFMSGYISDEGKRSAIGRLGLPYITKPFEPRQLLEIVRKELDRV